MEFPNWFFVYSTTVSFQKMMSLNLVLLLAMVAVHPIAIRGDRRLIHDHIPEKSPGQSWTPGRNARFDGMTFDDLRAMLGDPIPIDELEKKGDKLGVRKPNYGVPDSFNAAEYWTACANSINTVRDQGACKAYGASAAASAMSDMTCIACNGNFRPYLSEQDILACCTNCGDCVNGGRIDLAFEYWKSSGVVSGGPYNSTDGCMPYTIGPGNVSADTPTCPSSPTCESSYPSTYSQDKHRGVSYDMITKGMGDMQLGIYTYGPITVINFDVYSDFVHYTDGIYHHTSGDRQGTQAVKVIGWGADNGVAYWLCVNSWGTDWGMKGFFKIRRGSNECNFEQAAIEAKSSSTSCFDFGPTTTTISTISTSQGPTLPSTTAKGAAILSINNFVVAMAILIGVGLKSMF